MEVLFAPGYDAAALEALERKQNIGSSSTTSAGGVDARDYKRVLGGLLVQDRTPTSRTARAGRWVTRNAVRARLGRSVFAWRVCKHVLSNAIVIAKDLADDRHRRRADEPVDAVNIAVEKAARTGTTSPMPSSPRMPSSLSPMARGSHSPPESRRSSSRAAPAATRT